MKAILKIVFAAGLLLAMILGMGLRREVFHAQVVTAGHEIPFTLESALQYRMVTQVYEKGRLPEIDRECEVPNGVNVRRTYSVGAEYVYAFLARCLPSGIPLAERVRWIALFWFCLGIPMLGLWIAWSTESRWSGWIAALFYAVSLSSIMRSTGQELSRENFALPLLLAHLAFDAFPAKSKRGKWTVGILSAVFLGWSAMTWDLVQFYVILWAFSACLRVAMGPVRVDGEFRFLWSLQFVVLVLFSLCNPYLRSHHWLLSPGLLLGYGVTGAMSFEWLAKGRWRSFRWYRVGIMLLPLCLGLLVWGSGYGESYGHFSELVYAKIRWLNQKPLDPSLLTFNQRIMWVPGLNSASWRLGWTLFPAMFILTSVAGIVICINQVAHPRYRLIQQLIYCCASLITFCFFVRFHVFLSIFSAGLLGCWLAHSLKRAWWQWSFVVFLLVTGLIVEAGHVVMSPTRWGRPNIYYKELLELTEWFDKECIKVPVLANFGVGSSLLTYGKCPIVLHPKFESQEIRERVESYGEHLFKGTERSFRDWADQYDVAYYVHSMGELSRRSPERQMRYMVDALEPAEDAPVRIFEQNPYTGRYFRYLWGNTKYRVFQMLSESEEKLSLEMSHSAKLALQHGDLLKAKQLANMALTHDPLSQPAWKTITHVESLQRQGFRYESQMEKYEQ